MSKKAVKQITNQDLNFLLIHLGFQPSIESVNQYRAWKHAESNTLILLPANKLHEPPLKADLSSMGYRLDFNGLLTKGEFEEFQQTGKLPVTS